MNKIYNSKNFILRNLTVIVAFLIPVIALIIMYIPRGIFPFGDEMYMRSDSYHQYCTFLKEFQSMLKNGDSLLYTWNIGLGSDFPGTYAYYLATPFYWFVGLFSDKIIPEIMSSLIILKAGLMSATFTYYVQERTKKKDFAATAFGLFYAFSSYMAAYSWNLMWLDCLVLLPLITLGLERLVKKKRAVLYTITLSVAILSNYYIAIMICIYLVLYFLYLIICEGRFKNAKAFFATVGRFSVYSILAGLMAAVIVVPAMINLFSTASGSFTFPTKLRFYFNILEMFSHAVMNVEPTVLSGYIPNIYCTIGLFMIYPLYIMCRKINFKRKIGKTVLMVIFLFSFALNIPTYIWHGFHYPNSLSSRQSFIYIFLVLVIGYEVLIRIRTFKYIEIIGSFVAGVLAIYGLQALYDSDKYTMLLVSISAGFLTLYFIWMMLKKQGILPQQFFVISLLVICIGETMVNTNYTGYTTTTRSSYMKDNADYSKMLSEINDDGFYRVEKVTRRTKNDGAWLNYRSASEFSSTTLNKLSDFYAKFGMQSSTNSFSYYGHTPLTTALLGVKYELASKEVNDPLMTMINESNEYYLYQNKYSLSLGFIVDDDLFDKVLSGDQPFVVQSNFAKHASGVDGLYNILDKVKGETALFSAKEDGKGFIYLSAKVKAVYVTITRNGQELSKEKYSSLENKQIVDIGMLQKGDNILVESADDDVTKLELIPAIMRMDKLDQVMAALSSEQLKIVQFEDTYVKGTINTSNGGYMFTSIPYYEGWEVFVDGQKCEYTSFEKAFIVLKLEAGEHTIEFKYHSPYLIAGMLISFFAIILFILLSVLAYRKRKHLPVKKDKQITEADDKAEAVNENKTEITVENAENATVETSEDEAMVQPEESVSNEPKSAKKENDIIMNDELAQMSERLAKISGELAKMGEKPLAK